MQCYRLYARFDVAAADLNTAVKTIVSSNNYRLGRSPSYPHRSLKEDEAPRGDVQRLKLKWWNVDDISKGYNVGENEPSAVHMWIDVDRNRIYLYLSQ